MAGLVECNLYERERALSAAADEAAGRLYDPDKMPADLAQAHLGLDRAVEAAYGVDFGGDEESIVAHLFKLYAEATSKGE